MLKNFFKFFLYGQGITLSLLFLASALPVQAAPSSNKNWQLIFEDNFDDANLDESKWSKITGERRTGFWEEADAYLDGNGNLVLRTRKQSDSHYSSGAVRTRDKFEHTYGYYEASIKPPQLHGHWPGFWLLNPYVWYESCSPWNTDPGLDPWGVQKTCGTEIDIVELPILEHGFYHTVWWYDDQSSNMKHYYHETKDMNNTVLDPNNYHLFGLEWTESEYIFYVDGQETARFNSSQAPISHAPEYIKLTEEIDWDNPDIAGDIRQIAGFSEDFTYVDYVRVYEQVAGSPTPLPSPLPSPTPSPTPSPSVSPSPTASPLPTCNIADINQDGKVDLLDYTLLASNFFKNNPDPARADINQDNKINLLDYSILASNFFVNTGDCL